jgi:hypothetical protein
MVTYGRERDGDRPADSAGRDVRTDPVTPALAAEALRAALTGRYPEHLLPPAATPALAHPNGFLKIPVALTGDGRRIFLHVWQDDCRDAQQHDHRWHLGSLVLAGRLTNELIQVGPPGPASGTVWRIAHYVPGPRSFRLDSGPADPVAVHARSARRMGEGETYRMRAGQLHRADALAGTMTLVARSVPLQRHSRVLVAGEVDGGPRRWCPVPGRERLAQLRAALGRLA